MGVWILTSTILFCWLVTEHEFRKVAYLDNSKTSYSTPEPAKYNDVFKVDETESTKKNEESLQEMKTNEERNGEGKFSRGIKPVMRGAHGDQRSALLKRIVESEMRISSTDFQMNGVLGYSAENFDLDEHIFKSSVNKNADSVVLDQRRSSVGNVASISGRKKNIDSNYQLLCSDCNGSFGSMRKDISVLKDELSLLSQEIHSAINGFNCTKREFFKPDYQWKLDGRCEKGGSQHHCSLSCSDLFHYPTTAKTPIGRSSRQVHLTRDRSSACAVKLNSGDFIDLGEWAGSCVAQPDRCPAGLSLTVWLRLDLSNANFSCLVMGGNPCSAGRGFAVFASRQDDQSILLTVKVRDSTHVWNAEGLVEGHVRWQHFAFTWSKNHGLELFLNGNTITRRQAVVKEASRPSPLTRLLIGSPPGTKDSFVGSFSMANLSLYVSHLHQKDISTIYYQENEMNSVGN